MTFKNTIYVASLFLSIVSIGIANTYAQTNLVKNGGFEQNIKCPKNLTDSQTFNSLVGDWKSPTSNSPKYFNSCAPISSGLSVPDNYAGSQIARSGVAYAGLSVFTNPTTYDASLGKLRQYLQTKLNSPLKAGRSYYFEMFVSKADSSTMGYAVSNIGAYFSSSNLSRNDSFEFAFTPQIVSTAFLSDRLNWVKISGTYVASGGEQYLTIGRFGNEDATTVMNINGFATRESYYYLDDVALIDSCSGIDNVANQILGPDSSFCLYAPFSKSINVTNPQTTNYLWDNGSIFPLRTFTDTGRYWVQLTNGNCQSSDTLFIKSNQKPGLKLGNDTAICFNTPVILKSSEHKNHYAYRWYISAFGTNFLVSTTPSYSINSPDTIIAIVDDFACSNSDTILVRKSTMKRVTLPADSSFCRQVQLLLSASSTTASNFIWNTGARTPSITTTNLPQYWVTASDGLCTSTDTVTITYKGAKAPVKDTTICETGTLVLHADSSATYRLWNTNETTPSIFALFDGEYWITQHKDGCVTYDTTSVTINKVPIINLGNDTNVCVSPFYVLNATSPYGTKYLWNTGDTSALLQAGTTGNYIVKVSNQTCSFADTILLRIQINTPFSFGPDKYDCFETGIVLSSSISRVDSFQWSTLSRDSFIMVKQPGKYWLRTSSGYCTNYDTIELFAKPKPSIFLGNDTIVCWGENLTVDAQNPDCSFVWSTGDTSQTILLKRQQTYWVVATNSEGCRSADTISFDYHPVTKAFSQHAQNMCKGSTIFISPTSTLSGIQWFDGQTNPTYATQKPGWISITATDSVGCPVKDSVMITERPLPDIDIEKEVLACDLPVELTPGTIFPEQLWQDTLSADTYQAKEFGSYKLTVTDAFECSNTAYITVTNNCPSDVTIPNVFTPDNNGKNDYIIPEYTNIKETSWQIFNRWGQLVFSTTNIDENWNGMIDRKEAEAGVYYYTLICKGSRDEKIERTGTLTLIR
jgi:gliding motility-associated-like protein